MENEDLIAARERPLIPITLEEELRKNPQLKEQDVALLRDWVYMQPHLPPLHDRELALFLLLSDYSVEAAKCMTDTVMTLRTHIPEFSERDPMLPELQISAKDWLLAILPKATPDGYKVFFNSSVDTDPTTFQSSHVLKIFTMVIDLWLLSEGAYPGLVYIFDMKGMSFAHLPGMSILAMRNFFLMQDNFYRFFKSIHIINIVPFTDTLLSMMKPFMKKEFRDKLHVHKNISDLYKYVPQDILPEDLGGSAPSLVKLKENMRSHLLANREYFLAEEQRRVDETKRPGRPRSAEDLFGVEGTFKKLDID